MKKALTTQELRGQKIKRLEFKNTARRKIVLFLDRLQNNYNLGAILRLADAGLVEEVLIYGAQANLRGKKTLRAARGVVDWVPHRFIDNDVDAIKDLKEKDYRILALELCEDSVVYYESDLPEKVCLIMGSETEGVSEQLLSLADQRIYIPMAGMANSLNVATATGIALFDLIRRKTK